MIESRCGVLCSECKYKETMKCSGCLYITKPFWGEQCPLKSCCESKKMEYCGACKTFPCDLLTQFSYDKDQGDNGQRIEQCEKWASK